MKKILIVVNPVSGGGAGLRLQESFRGESAIVAALAKETGASAPESWPVLRTTPDGSWKRDIQTYLSAGPTAGDLVGIAVIGGDGTLTEVATLLYEAKTRSIPLIPLPGGRGNDFIRGLVGYTAADGEYWSWAEKRQSWSQRKIDLGSANGRIFLNMASLGFGGRVVEKAHGRQAVWSKTAMVYQVEGALAFLAGAAGGGKCDASCDGEHLYQGPFFGAFVGNGRANGHGLYWTKDAEIDDAKLDAIVFPRPGLLEMVRSLNAVKGKKLPTFRHKQLKAREIIFHFDRPVPLELDGEFAGSQLTHEFQAIPRALSVWVPKV